MSQSSSDPERYLTTAELDQELPFTSEDFPVQSDTQFANALTRALDAASALAEQWSDTRFVETTVSETVTHPVGVDGRDLPLPKRPIKTIDVVTADVDGTATDIVADVRVAGTHLVLEDTAPIAAWPTDTEIDVTYTYGYSEVPGPVVEAIVRLARNRLDQIETDGVESDRTASESWTYRTPGAIKSECYPLVAQYQPESYYGGAQLI